MKKNIFLLILIIASLAIFTAACASDETPPAQEEELVEEEPVSEEPRPDNEDDHDHDHEVEEGMAPDLFYHEKDGSHGLLKNLAGEEVSLEDYEGKVVFLSFWTTWCTYCKQQMPDVQRVHEEMDDVVVIAVNVNESKEQAEKYMEEGGYTFEVVLDTTGEVAQNYLVSGFPTSYTIKEDGSISHFFGGMLTSDAMDEMIDLAREEK